MKSTYEVLRKHNTDCLIHRRSQDFVWDGAHFLAKKVDDLKNMCKYTSKSNPPSKNCPKIDSCSGWGALRVLGVHLHIFPANYACKNFFFTALGGASAPNAPPGYAYGLIRAAEIIAGERVTAIRRML